jgi:hypothetical protein
MRAIKRILTKRLRTGMALSVLLAGAGMVALAGPAHAASDLTCTSSHSGPDATATCWGTGTWQMDIYCDWPSPSPIANGWISQDDGVQTSKGSCWFGRNVQFISIEEK